MLTDIVTENQKWIYELKEARQEHRIQGDPAKLDGRVTVVFQVL